VVTDVTESVRLRLDLEVALAEARRHEQQLEVLFEHSTEVAAIMDPDGQLLFASGSRLSPLVTDPGVPLEIESAFEYAHPDDQGLVRRMHAQALAQPGTTIGPVTYRLNRPEGSDRWAESTWVNLIHRAEVRGIVAHTRDVTDRTVAELRLRDREERFRLLVEFSTESIMVVGPDGELLYNTPNLEQEVGWVGACSTSSCEISPICRRSVAWCSTFEMSPSGAASSSATCRPRRWRRSVGWWVASSTTSTTS
jgi:PAS domain-containing protein